MILGYIYCVVLLLLTAISLLSLLVLKSASPCTSAGWVFTIFYDAAASAEILHGSDLPYHLPYFFLGALAVAFVVAGVRDEAQAEPWWAPKKLALTRAQKRA